VSSNDKEMQQDAVEPTFAVIATAASRVSGQAEYFLLKRLGAASVAQGAEVASDDTVLNHSELIELLDSRGGIVVLCEGQAPQPLVMRYGTHGYRYFESVRNGKPTDAVRRLPRFAFVGEAKTGDFLRLSAIEGGELQQPVAVAEEAMQRYLDFGWVERTADGYRLTTLGRALLSYVK
jgi:hypothetical protein